MINFDLNTTEKNIVGSVNEVNGNLVGQKYKDSEAGEIFNGYADNEASGRYSHAEGRDTVASGDYSHAEGQNTHAIGTFSHAEGQSTTATRTWSHVEGCYNYEIKDAIHTVGIGDFYKGDKNAHVILYTNGDHYIIGIGNYTGKNITTSTKSLQTVISDLEEIHTPVITEGDPDLWGTQEAGTIDGTLTQVQYDAIKERIENGLPVIIRVDYAAGYTSTFTAVSTSPSNTPGRYTFCYIDYNTNENQYFLKWFKMESDLTCQVSTKII